MKRNPMAPQIPIRNTLVCSDLGRCRTISASTSALSALRSPSRNTSTPMYHEMRGMSESENGNMAAYLSSSATSDPRPGNDRTGHLHGGIPRRGIARSHLNRKNESGATGSRRSLLEDPPGCYDEFAGHRPRFWAQ